MRTQSSLRLWLQEEWLWELTRRCPGLPRYLKRSWSGHGTLWTTCWQSSSPPTTSQRLRTRRTSRDKWQRKFRRAPYFAFLRKKPGGDSKGGWQWQPWVQCLRSWARRRWGWYTMVHTQWMWTGESKWETDCASHCVTMRPLCSRR